MKFANRQEAGQALAERLHEYDDRAVVYALPRGGVVLGAIIAAALRAPLDLVMGRKLGHPQSPEFAIGALAEKGPALWDQREAEMMPQSWRDEAVEDASHEIALRKQLYYPSGFKRPKARGQAAIMVDDGIATGLSMKAAVQSVARKQPAELIIAAPVASDEAFEDLRTEANEIVLLKRPEDFGSAVGIHYADFRQVTDEEVMSIMERFSRG